MIKRWSVVTRGRVLHLACEYSDCETQCGQQPGEEAVVLEAEAASPVVHDLVVEKGEVELDLTAAMHREVFKRHRQKVTGVNRPQHL